MSEEVHSREMKLKLLQLADELGNVKEACRRFAVSRDTFYRYKRQYEENGILGLENKDRKKPNLKNRVSAQIENIIVEKSLSNPKLGVNPIKKYLEENNIHLSSSGVRSILKRNGLENMYSRIMFLYAMSIQKRMSLSPSQNEQVEKFRKLSKIKSRKPFDNPWMGFIKIFEFWKYSYTTMKGLNTGYGKNIIRNNPNIYVYIYVDHFSRYLIVRLYDRENENGVIDFKKRYIFEEYKIQQSLKSADLEKSNNSSDWKPLNMGFRAITSPFIEILLKDDHKVGLIDDFFNDYLLPLKEILSQDKSEITYERLQIEVNNLVTKCNQKPTHSNYCYGLSPLETFRKLYCVR